MRLYFQCWPVQLANVLTKETRCNTKVTCREVTGDTNGDVISQRPSRVGTEFFWRERACASRLCPPLWPLCTVTFHSHLLRPPSVDQWGCPGWGKKRKRENRQRGDDGAGGNGLIRRRTLNEAWAPRRHDSYSGSTWVEETNKQTLVMVRLKSDEQLAQMQFHHLRRERKRKRVLLW